jgi:hypothetical protein
MEPWLQLAGRLHPIAAHLPIGLFILLAVIELAGAFPGGPRLTAQQRSWILSLGFLGAATTASFGWLLAGSGDYDDTILERHRWLGVGFAATTAVLYFLRHRPGAYAAGLTVSVALLGFAGHAGGTLTHGESYLSLSTVAAASPAPTRAEDTRLFDDVIHPILQQRCVSCHGASKSQGDLRYDTREFLVQGGKSGLSFKPGDAHGSLLIKRAHLPLEAKQHMPPKEKPQLTEDELTLLEWWIDVGAPFDVRVSAIEAPPLILERLATRLGWLREPPPDRALMLAEAAALEQRLGVLLRPLTQDGPWLAANARVKLTAFGDAELAALAPIAPALYWLDLGETGVTDAGLGALAAMKNLRRLQLDRTAITGTGLRALSGLSQLETLNLHGTRLTDADLSALESLPRLRSLYLWQTQVSAEAAARLGQKQTDHRRIARWRTEMAALEAKIRAETFRANLGTDTESRPSSPPAPTTARSP